MKRKTGEKCTVESCWRPITSRQLCQMHWKRWKRNGDPLIKRRARGVMDAPVVPYVPRRPKREGPFLGPQQTRLLCLIWREPVELTVIANELGVQPACVMQKVSNIRRRFGYDAIRTSLPKGKRAHYQLNPAVLR